MNRTRLATIGTICGAVSVLALAGTAHAHVTVTPDEATQGGYTTLSFKVPNERDDASTIQLEVTFDPEHPLPSVMPQPVPGWDIEVETAPLDEPLEVHGSEINEAPSKITWSGGEIEPGTFQQFPVSMGSLPESEDQLVFKAVQTYDSDEVVRWIEEPSDDGTEPEHPAPVLQLTPAAQEGAGAPEAAGQDGGEAAADTENSAADSSDTTARVLGGIGIAVGAVGVAFGVLAGRRRSA